MKKQILAACLAALLAASLAACTDAPVVTTASDIAVTEPTSTSEMTTASTETETEIKGFRVNAEKDAFVWTGDVREGLAALEDSIAELHPTAGKFTATFGAVTLEMAVEYGEDGYPTVTASGVSVGPAHRIGFSIPYQISFANGGVSLFTVGDATVLTYIDPAQRADNYVLDESGIVKLRFSAETDGTDYNAPVLLLTDRDGTLGFVCWPKKFAGEMARFAYLVGTDELLEVEGSATCRDGKFSFGVTAQRTFADLNANGALDYAYFCDTGEDASALAARMAENAKQVAPFTLSDFAACFSVAVPQEKRS